MIGGNKRQKGFTLIEVLVSVTIFVVVVSIGATLFISVTSSQRKTIVQERVLREVRDTTETLARVVRTNPVLVEDYVSGGSSLAGPQDRLLLSVNNENIAYFLVDNKIKYRDGSGQEHDVTSDEVSVTNLEFYLSPQDLGNDDWMTRVTILLTMESTSDLLESPEIINVQTTVGSRLYNDIQN